LDKPTQVVIICSTKAELPLKILKRDILTIVGRLGFSKFLCKTADCDLAELVDMEDD